MASDRTECIVKHQRSDSVLPGCEVDCFVFSDNLVNFATAELPNLLSSTLLNYICTKKSILQRCKARAYLTVLSYIEMRLFFLIKKTIGSVFELCWPHSPNPFLSYNCRLLGLNFNCCQLIYYTLGYYRLLQVNLRLL